METLKKLRVLLVMILMVSCIQKDNLVDDQKTGNGDERLVVKSAPVSQVIDGRYIVVFRDQVLNPRAETALLKGLFGMQTGHVYEHTLKGFSAQIPDQALNGLRNHPLIKYIEPDITMEALGQVIPTGLSRIEATTAPASPVDVDVAIIDTGIDKEHPELNVVNGIRYYLGFFSDSNYDDDNGHGSHVAGIIGARHNDVGVVGIVPGARLWAVKVLNKKGSGYLSDIIKGLEWVEARAGDIEVANMSLGGNGLSESYQTAIRGCVNAGVVVVVAAGNSAVDVYGKDGIFGTGDDYIPAAYPEAATISALADSDGEPGGMGVETIYGADDSFASFSNFSHTVVPGNPVSSPGLAIDLILPGVDILSTYKDMGYASMSGTSMASPHAAGLAALYVSRHGRAENAAGVYAIRQALINGGKAQNDAGLGLVNGGDPDGNLENLGWAETGTPPPNSAPRADAGDDQTVIDTDGNGTETVTLDGSGSTDDKGIASYNWTRDGSPVSTEVSFQISLTPGTYTFALTVEDEEGLTSSDQVTLTVSPNSPPVADFSYSADGLTVHFTDLSSDDGTILSRSWDFGDGQVSGQKDPVHTYGSSGTYTVSLSVTDNGNAVSTMVKTIQVSEVVTPVIVLTAFVYKLNKVQFATNLSWTGATSAYVDLYRNGVKIVTTENDGSYMDNVGKKSGITYVYRICESGTNTCSNDATVTTP